MRRGQIWLYNSDPSVGDEIGKTRPAVVVNNDEIGKLRLKIIVPITNWNDTFLGVIWMVRLDPTEENGSRLAFSSRYVSSALNFSAKAHSPTGKPL